MPLYHSFWLHWVSHNPQVCRDVAVIMEVQMSLHHKPESNRIRMAKNKSYNHTSYLLTRFSWTKSKAARWDHTYMGSKLTQEKQVERKWQSWWECVCHQQQLPARFSTSLGWKGSVFLSMFTLREESDHKFWGYLDCQFTLWLPVQVQCR